MWTSAHAKLAAAGLLLFILQAWRSDGYYSSDEYFQVVELASYKLGVTPPSDLAWEFHDRMRPFFQPALCFGAVRALRVLGATAPRTAMLTFRLLFALIGWAAMLLLWRALAPRLSDERARSWLLAACLFTWYLPFFLVRTSSESLSGSLLAIGLAAYLLLERRPAAGALAAGLAMGLSFDARYQVGFAVLGFFAWLALFRRRRAGALAAFAFGFLFAAAIGVILDRWGYGEWTLAPWNYLRENLVEGRADLFGRRPITFYLTHTSVVQPPLSALLLALTFTFWLKAPRHPITWLTIPFFLGHTMIGHKEVRFLYPLLQIAAAIGPLLLLDPLLRPQRLHAVLERPWGRRLLQTVLGLNVAFLVGLFVIPIRHELSVQYRLWEIAREPASAPVLVVGRDPFTGVGLNRPFLRPPGWRPTSVQSWADVEARVRDLGGRAYVTSQLSDLPPESLESRLHLRLLVSPVPESIARLLARPIERTTFWALWLVELRDL